MRVYSCVLELIYPDDSDSDDDPDVPVPLNSKTGALTVIEGQDDPNKSKPKKRNRFGTKAKLNMTDVRVSLSLFVRFSSTTHVVRKAHPLLSTLHTLTRPEVHCLLY